MSRTIETTLDSADVTAAPEPGQMGAHLFLVLRCDALPAPSARFPLLEIDEVVLGRGKTFAWSKNGSKLDVRVPDGWMSSTHATIKRQQGAWRLEDTGSKNGTVVNGAAATRATLGEGDVVELGHTFFLFREVPADGLEPRVLGDSDVAVPPDDDDGAAVLRTLSTLLGRELAQLVEIARSEVPVLVHGETGTGKELICRLTHARSGRRGKRVAVNCGAIPANLVESTLFGHRKGAFSGAIDDRAGLVKAAGGGTLFLDEIADLPLQSQAALLRVLQEREVVPVGATQPEPIDFRLVAATHHDLAKRVADGHFRADLLMRLSGFKVELPALRDRREDLGVLIGTLLQGAQRRGKPVEASVEFARALLRYSWPGNVRELERALSAAVVLAKGARLQLAHLPAEVRGGEPTSSSGSRPAAQRPGPDAARRPADIKTRLVELLAEHAGNVSAVARAMHTSRSQVHRWAKRHGIDLGSARDGQADDGDGDGDADADADPDPDTGPVNAD